MTDPWDDPDTQRWLKHCREELVPMIQKSAVTVSLVPSDASDTDIKFAVELGLSIMLGKPIITVIRPGQQVPPGLVKVSDKIIEWDQDPTPEAKKRFIDSLIEVVPEIAERGGKIVNREDDDEG